MKRWPIYPFLLGLFPLLTVYQANTAEVGFNEVLLPAALVLVGTLIVLLATWPLMRSSHRAAIFTAAVVWCFMTFQRWTTALAWATARFNPQTAQPWEVFGLQVLLLAFIFYKAGWKLKTPENWTRPLNLMSAAIVALPVLTVLWQLGVNQHATAGESAEPDRSPALITSTTVPRQQWPDIYLIVLDAHARADILSDLYQYNVEPFLQKLREKGFYIADSSNSNYPATELSVASMLNMRYLDELNGRPDDNFNPVLPLIQHSALEQTLHAIGYKWVAFQSFWATMCLPDSDVYIHLPKMDQTSQFNQLLIDSTMTSLFPDAHLALQSDTMIMDSYHAKRTIIKYEFAHVADAFPVTGPKFVFFHIFSPHPPFVFDARGPH